jgi:hypothetical protein
MNQDKFNFLKNDFLPRVNDLPGDAIGKWGKMSGQQMVEHVCDFFKVSTDKIHFKLVTPEEQLPKYREFMMSEKEFRENTVAPMLPPDPFPIRSSSMKEAVAELDAEVKAFFDFFRDDAEKRTLHPAFGPLNFAEWVQLHHKHVRHHLKQFGLTT